MLNSVTASPSTPDYCGGVERIVLVDEQGVEQLLVAGDAVDVAERQVLMLQGVVVGAVQLRRVNPRWWWSR